ncbi:hypothetical protein L9F63_003347, partial [Diploptera punctata]
PSAFVCLPVIVFTSKKLAFNSVNSNQNIRELKEKNDIVKKFNFENSTIFPSLYFMKLSFGEYGPKFHYHISVASTTATGSDPPLVFLLGAIL